MQKAYGKSIPQERLLVNLFILNFGIEFRIMELFKFLLSPSPIQPRQRLKIRIQKD